MKCFEFKGPSDTFPGDENPRHVRGARYHSQVSLYIWTIFSSIEFIRGIGMFNVIEKMFSSVTIGTTGLGKNDDFIAFDQKVHDFFHRCFYMGMGGKS